MSQCEVTINLSFNKTKKCLYLYLSKYAISLTNKSMQQNLSGNIELQKLCHENYALQISKVGVCGLNGQSISGGSHA